MCFLLTATNRYWDYLFLRGMEKTRKRVIFEYTRQASMLMKYVPDQNLIVFDHLSPPDPKMKNQHDSYGPDLTYDGYRLKNGKWIYAENLDMRNVPNNTDENYVDPKKAGAKRQGKCKGEQLVGWSPIEN